MQVDFGTKNWIAYCQRDRDTTSNWLTNMSCRHRKENEKLKWVRMWPVSSLSGREVNNSDGSVDANWCSRLMTTMSDDIVLGRCYFWEDDGLDCDDWLMCSMRRLIAGSSTSLKAKSLWNDICFKLAMRHPTHPTLPNSNWKILKYRKLIN